MKEKYLEDIQSQVFEAKERNVTSVAVEVDDTPDEEDVIDDATDKLFEFLDGAESKYSKLIQRNYAEFNKKNDQMYKEAIKEFFAKNPKLSKLKNKITSELSNRVSEDGSDGPFDLHLWLYFAG